MSQIPTPESRPLVGVSWMLLAGLSFVIMTAIVKHVGSDLPAAQSAFLRFLTGLVFFIPMARSLTRVRLSRLSWRLLALRGVVHTLGVICWFYAMARIPVAEVTAMNYLNPVYVTLGAALFMGEKISVRRISAIGMALVGVLIILRPGFREISTGHLAMLVTAVMLAASYLCAKVASREAGPGTVVAILSVSVTIGLAPFAALVWVTPTWGQLAWLFLVAGFATAGHYFMTRAFRAAPMAVIQPVTFLQLVWATLLGWVVFGEGVDGWVILGGSVILGSVSYITWRETRLKRRAVTPAANATKL
ncbi:MAG: DMT family transporter [Paracoccaceae bacterium]